MEFKGIALEGRCNGKHTYIRYDDKTRLFVLYVEIEAPIAEGLKPSRLAEFAFVDGALTVCHLYDLRLAI